MDTIPRDADGQPSSGEPAVPAWWKIYEGLDDTEIERLDQAIRPRANLTRNFESSGVKDLELPNAVVDYSAFKFNKYFWTGRHMVPWLQSEANFIIQGEHTSIPSQQRVIVEFAIGLPAVTKDKLENFLFDEYQSEIFGSIDAGDIDITPKIVSSAEIWRLVSKPGIHTPENHRIEPDCYFEVSFECVWDDEHGIAVLFNDRGQPIAFGGQGSHF